MAKQPTYREFFQRFPDDQSCLEHLMRTRYGESHECAKCGKEARFYRAKQRRSYACEYCGHQVYPMAGTPFENTRTSLQDWFFVMHLFCASRNGVSAKEVERQIGCTYKTAWRMCRLIRTYMGQVDGDDNVGGEGKTVQVDETFVGGKTKGRDKGLSNKITVMGMAENDGNIVTEIVPDRQRTTLLNVIGKRVNVGSAIHTDEHHAYKILRTSGDYTHASVNHNKKEYVASCGATTNSIEGFWNLFKAAYHGTYVHVSQKYLDLYLDEFEFRWNRRKRPEAMISDLLQGFAKPVCR